MCNKISFHSADEARDYIKYINNPMRGTKPNKQNTYLCPDCGEYHVTQQKKLKSMKKARRTSKKQWLLIKESKGG